MFYLLLVYLLHFSSNVHVTFKFEENMQEIIKPAVHFVVKITGIILEFVVKAKRIYTHYVIRFNSGIITFYLSTSMFVSTF